MASGGCATSQSGGTTATLRGQALDTTEKQVEAFVDDMKASDKDGLVFVGAKQGANPDEIRVTVTSTWNLMDDKRKLKMANAMWGYWSKAHSPSQLEQSRIKVVSQSGVPLAYSDNTGSDIKLER
jgi:hypothetical protein